MFYYDSPTLLSNIEPLHFHTLLYQMKGILESPSFKTVEEQIRKSTTSIIRIFVPNSFRISSNMSLQTELLPKTEEGSIIHFSLCSDRVDTSRKQSGLLWKLYNHHLHTSFIVVVEDGCQ